MTCKFSKRVSFVKRVDTWLAEQWAHTFLKRLDLIDWDLREELIINWDPKFLGKLWTALFLKLKVKLLYNTAYYL